MIVAPAADEVEEVMQKVMRRHQSSDKGMLMFVTTGADSNDEHPKSILERTSESI